MEGRKLKIAVFGLGADELTEQNKEDAFRLGQLIAKRGHILITGLAQGVTLYAAKGNKSEDGLTIGINPFSKEQGQDDTLSYSDTDVIINTGFMDRGRNVISVRTADGMIVINGSFGVLNEITIGVGENKPIVVLKSSGGVSHIIEAIFKELKPDYKYFRLVEGIENCIPEIERMIKQVPA